MTLVVGLDVGATYTKAMVMDDEGRPVARCLARTGFDLAGAAQRTYDEVLRLAGARAEEIDYVASTGYGRYLAPMRDLQITELTCHARGAVSLFPATRTVLDAGGQTVKAIKVDERGKVRAFRLNDKCAAGTGAFLEKTARYMGIEPDSVGELASASETPVTISSVCAVFAESEVINHLTAGVAAQDIMYGAVLSLAGRAVQLMKRAGLEAEVTFTGGMSRNQAFVRALGAELEAIGTSAGALNVPPDDLGQFNGALGAGLLALERVRKLRAAGEFRGHREAAAGGVR